METFLFGHFYLGLTKRLPPKIMYDKVVPERVIMQEFVDCFRAAKRLMRRVPSPVAPRGMVVFVGLPTYFNDGEEV